MKEKIAEIQIPFNSGYLSWKLGWSPEFALGALREYKRFLVLALTSPHEVTPSKSIDEVWHYHILHTAAYAQFAEKVGRFLHHHPGGPSEKESLVFNSQYERTKELYERTFGEPAPEEFWPGETKQKANLRDVLSKFIKMQEVRV